MPRKNPIRHRLVRRLWPSPQPASVGRGSAGSDDGRIDRVEPLATLFRSGDINPEDVGTDPEAMAARLVGPEGGYDGGVCFRYDDPAVDSWVGDVHRACTTLNRSRWEQLQLARAGLPDDPRRDDDVSALHYLELLGPAVWEVPPERWVALHAHTLLFAGPLAKRYADPTVDAWVGRVMELLRGDLDALREEWLSPDEQAEVAAFDPETLI